MATLYLLFLAKVYLFTKVKLSTWSFSKYLHIYVQAHIQYIKSNNIKYRHTLLNKMKFDLWSIFHFISYFWLEHKIQVRKTSHFSIVRFWILEQVEHRLSTNVIFYSACVKICGIRLPQSRTLSPRDITHKLEKICLWAILL